MGGLIPLRDATRRPVRKSLCTALIIAVNILVFLTELARGVPSSLNGPWFRPNYVGVPCDHDPHCDVYARQLVAHHRQYGIPVGFRT